MTLRQCRQNHRPRGKVTTIADNFGDGTNPDTGVVGAQGATFALPTQVTNAVGHIIKKQYDLTPDTVTGIKDPNSVIPRQTLNSRRLAKEIITGSSII